MEYISGVSLDKYLQENLLDIKLLSWMIQELVAAVEFLHKREIRHLDITPSNLLINASKNRIVLIDFGLGMAPGIYGIKGGTPGFTQPDILLNLPEKNLKNADYYSLGKILLFIIQLQDKKLPQYAESMIYNIISECNAADIQPKKIVSLASKMGRAPLFKRLFIVSGIVFLFLFGGILIPKKQTAPQSPYLLNQDSLYCIAIADTYQSFFFSHYQQQLTYKQLYMNLDKADRIRDSLWNDFVVRKNIPLYSDTFNYYYYIHAKRWNEHQQKIFRIMENKKKGNKY